MANASVKKDDTIYLHKTDKMNAKLLADKQRKPPLKRTIEPPKKKEKDEKEDGKKKEEEAKDEKEKEKEEKENKKADKSKKRAAKENAKEEKEKEEKELKKLIKKHEERERDSRVLTFKDFTKPTKLFDKEKPKKLCHPTAGSSRETDYLQTGIGKAENLVDTIFHEMTMNLKPTEKGLRPSPEFVLLPKYFKREEVENQVNIKEKSAEVLLIKVLQMYKPDEIFLAFNGGKDSTVVLHILNKYFQKNHCLKHIKIPTLYVEDPDAFTEVIEFIDDCTKLFPIELIKKKGDIRDALKAFCLEKPEMKAVFMGSRSTDPNCKNLKVIQPTDPDYLEPPIMRINPIVEWNCRDVWQYTYIRNVPYCILYQRGYTSLGNSKNTKPNPHLRIIDSDSGRVIDYRPGHELLDNDELERAGRI